MDKEIFENLTITQNRLILWFPMKTDKLRDKNQLKIT